MERDALENLIRAGFLDRVGRRSRVGPPGEARAALLRETHGLPTKRRRGAQGELPLPHPASWWESREGRGAGVACLPLPQADLERWESRVLGLDLRRHPLAAHREALSALGVLPGRRLRTLPHGTRARAAGVLECLQAPPTRSGALVHFLPTEDESGLLQSTIFEGLYRESGSLLYQTGAFLLDGRVEQDPRRGFSFLVERMADLAEMLEKNMTESDVAPCGSRTHVPGSGSREKKGSKAG